MYDGPVNVSRIIRGLVVAAFAAVLLYVALAIVADGPATLQAIGLVPVPVLLLMMSLAAFGFVLRALRWGWLMRGAGASVTTRDALYLHISGQAMAVTPGRVGEVVKPWMSREVSGLPMPAGVALLFTERVADLLGVCLLSLAGLAVLGAGGAWLLAGLVVVIVATAVVASPKFHAAVLRVLGGIRRAEGLTRSLGSAFAVMETSMSWRRLAVATPVSLLAWGIEGIGFWLCVRSLGFDGVGVSGLISIYAASTIVGAFTFLPGGIGFTEASLAGILIAVGMPAPQAAAATIVVRAATLWLGVAMGWIALATRPRTFARLRQAGVDG